ncbi:MAG TPA: hypothetical protein VNZ48_20520 [Xanthobacteraceae bacterium]|nr:hypothetical protein [Xanthobacteraceae bacterium]
MSKAADHATALALALDGDDVEAAQRLPEAPRLSEGRKIAERARHLGAYLQAPQTAEERARSVLSVRKVYSPVRTRQKRPPCHHGFSPAQPDQI